MPSYRILNKIYPVVITHLYTFLCIAARYFDQENFPPALFCRADDQTHAIRIRGVFLLNCRLSQRSIPEEWRASYDLLPQYYPRFDPRPFRFVPLGQSVRIPQPARS